jgi:hypothetical protein
MATIKSLAKEYAEYLELNTANPSAASVIVERINGLKYTKSGLLLGKDDKEKLVAGIEEALFSPLSSDGLTLTMESQDSTELIKLIKMIRSGVK